MLKVEDDVILTLNFVANATAERASTGEGMATETSCSPAARGPSSTSPIDDAPVRSSVGKGHILKGTVKSSRDCSPIEGAKIIFWVAGPNGQYDDDHRASVFTDATGAYTFESNFPGLYSTRPHIHLYVQAAGHLPVEQEHFPVEGHTEGTFDSAA
jgi:protocatechuate 3,4-dioxygenase beta subunit